jgi:predicted transcriptional regulator
MAVISLLKHETAGKILLILLGKQVVPHKTLSSRLGISSQALTWQTNRLKQMGFIKGVRKGMLVEYSLDEASVTTIRRCVNLIRGR